MPETFNGFTIGQRVRLSTVDKWNGRVGSIVQFEPNESLSIKVRTDDLGGDWFSIREVDILSAEDEDQQRRLEHAMKYL